MRRVAALCNKMNVLICGLLLLKFADGQPHGLTLMIKSQTYVNNSAISLTDVGVGADALICMTTRSDCCRGANAKGEWYYPNGDPVPILDMIQDGFFRNRMSQQVLLHRRSDAANREGLYCCELTDPTERICITLLSPMTSTSVATGMVTTPPPPPPPIMTMLSGSGGTFIAGQNHMLTCQFSGGDSSMPPRYQWLRNGQVIGGETGMTLSFTPLEIIDSGRYNCQVTRGSTDASGSINIGIVAPTVTISNNGQPTEGQRYVLTCNVNGAGSLSPSYQWDRVGGSSRVSTSQELTRDPLRRSEDGDQYRCTVTISSSLGSRTFESTEAIRVTNVMPGPISNLRATGSATSITITWMQSMDIFIDRFVVTYRYTVMRCSAPPSASRTDPISDGTRRSHTLSGLNEDSDYTITVRAINDVGSSMTTTVIATPTSAPSAGPTSVTRGTVRVVDITIQWGEVNCADRNGIITGYKVRHGLSSTAESERSITNSNTRMFTINRLLIRSTYSFEVAAVAGGRTGPYSSVLEVTTSVPTGLGFNLKGELHSNNSIVTITDIGSGTNALYCFTNKSGCCRDSESGANGEWFFPNRNAVEGNGRVSMSDFSRNRGPSAVLLNRRNDAMEPTGLYRCEVLDMRNVVQSIYVGLYISNRGTPSVSMLSYSRPSRTLTCVSTGGPATNVTWRKDGVIISPSSPSHQQSQRVVDTTTATYHNLLSITSSNISDYNGSFTCTVSNTRGSSQPMSLDISDCPIGSYLAETSNRATVCRPCPNNSVSTSPNSLVCVCLQGYYRNILEAIHVPCTRPPSACRNLRVYHPRTRANTITVRWERPLIIGRDDYYYNIFYSNPDIPENFTRHNRNPFIKDSSVVQYSVSGLRPLTNYIIRVTVHNGVSDQDPEGEQGRRCEISGVTGDIRAQAPRNVTSFCSVIVWKAPSRAYGVITGYHIFLVRRIDNDRALVEKNRDELFHAVNDYFKSGDAYFMVRAVTSSSIYGSWSEFRSLDCPSDAASHPCTCPTVCPTCTTTT